MYSTKILYLLNSSQIGGGNRSLLSLWKGLREYQVVPVVSCPGYGPMSNMVIELGISLYVQPYLESGWTSPLNTAKNTWRWLSMFKKEKISLVHANDPHVARPVLLAAAIQGIPVIAHVRFPQKREYYRWVYKYLPKPHGFILNSRSMQEELGPLLLEACPRAKQWMVHNAVDLELFTACYETGNSVLRVGIVANLNPVKRHEEFIEMARIIACQSPEVAFDVIGADIDCTGRGDFLANLAEKMGISAKITFHGHVKDVYRVITKLDVVVSTSHKEPFGRSIIEAMACGKPVVAYAVGGIPEIIIDGRTGYLVPKGGVQEMARRVQSLIESRKLRGEMGMNGRQRVEEKFGVATHTNNIMNIYDELL
jgi:glycosyltransferase involved in cell wall biosynthesis